MKGFARREFQLMLLRRMADFQPELVEAGHTELGATHAQYMAAHNRWQSMLRSRAAPKGLELYRAVLGPPDTERAIKVGDAEVTSQTWELPGLWPDLVWEAIVGVDNVVLHGWLVRTAGLAAPQLTELAAPSRSELRPWSCVVGDVLVRYSQARQIDPLIPTQWVVRLNGYQMWFVHGLYQSTSDTPYHVQ